MLKNNKHLIHYVPHGINPETYKPLTKKDDVYKEVYERVYGKSKYEFVVGFISRNMWRKNPTNLILGFRAFCDSLPKEKSKKCALVLKTEPIAEHGTDLIAIQRTFTPDYNVIINNDNWNFQQMNALYNTFDVYVNCSSNEGFGLGVAEAMMAGVPICATVTGGLQDQMGFVDNKGKPMEFSRDFASNFNMKYTKHGNWVYPMIPQSRNVNGSPMTPYVMEEFVDFSVIRDAIKYWYDMDSAKRKECGMEGRKWAMTDGGINSDNMCKEFIKAMDFAIENFIPKKKFAMFEYNDYYDITKMPNNSLGFELNE